MEKQEEGKHWYAGQCGPQIGGRLLYKTFSVGIFKWVKKSSGKGFKKSAVIYRVYGKSDNPSDVYDTAFMICKLMDLGAWAVTKKSERVY